MMVEVDVVFVFVVVDDVVVIHAENKKIDIRKKWEKVILGSEKIIQKRLFLKDDEICIWGQFQ